ncbi:MAG: iron-sulfur cluster assembly scaffold protein [Gemmatales bacterium]|nr:MAG: iron-sulfur cluster assembly scaffold protein [Gemmatales bacterium]
MSDLRELYQEVILDHHKKPRNFRRLEGDVRRVEGYNPLCGDRFTVYLQMEGDIVKDVAFEGSGCAISTASASMMTESVKGKTRAEAEDMFQKFHALLTSPQIDTTGLGKLAVFAGVREFPVRVKCATLAWHTLHSALQGKEETVSTE